MCHIWVNYTLKTYLSTNNDRQILILLFVGTTLSEIWPSQLLLQNYACNGFVDAQTMERVFHNVEHATKGDS